MDMGKWALTICVERIDEDFSLLEIESKIQVALMRKEKPHIIPLVDNRGVVMGDSWAEACCLDRQGSRFFDHGRVGYHHWAPCLGTVVRDKRVKARWVKLRGLPLHMWMDEFFAVLGDACGGNANINPRSSNHEDLWWVRLKIHPYNPGEIPKIVEDNDKEVSYAVLVVLENDLVSDALANLSLPKEVAMCGKRISGLMVGKETVSSFGRPDRGFQFIINSNFKKWNTTGVHSQRGDLRDDNTLSNLHGMEGCRGAFLSKSIPLNNSSFITRTNHNAL